MGAALSDAGALLYDRLFTMEAFARSVGGLYAALTPLPAQATPSAWPPLEERGR